MEILNKNIEVALENLDTSEDNKKILKSILKTLFLIIFVTIRTRKLIFLKIMEYSLSMVIMAQVNQLS